MNSIEGIQGDRYSVDIFESSMSIFTKEFAGEKEKAEEPEDEKPVSDEKNESTEDDDFFAETETVVPAGTVKTVIDFSLDNVKILEKQDYYIIYLVKRMFYVLPKNIFDEDEKKIITESFRKAKFIEERK